MLEMIQRGEVVGSSNDNDMNNRTNSLVDNVTTRNKDTMDDRDNTNPFADPPFADPFADSNPTVNVNSDTSLCSRSPSTSPFGNMTSIRGPRPISQVLMSYEEASGQNRQNGITVQRGVAVTVEGAPRMAMAREDEDWEDIGFGGAAHVGLGDAGDYRKEEEKQTDRKGSDGEGNEKSSK